MNKLKCLSGSSLKILAMALMLCDHLWGVGLLGWDWLTAVGRLAFPIFAFQIAEGWALTHDKKSYLKRMALFALISEIPFNYMMADGPFYPFSQNVMFTFLLAMLLMSGLEKFWKTHTGGRWYVFSIGCAVVLAYVLGFVTFVDYHGFGVVMVLLFWLTRDRKWGWAVQLAGMYLINWVQMGGQSYVWHLFGRELWIPQQGLAVLALIPIWMYNGKKGRGGKVLRWFGYWFYPLHIALLVLLAHLLQG